MFDLFVLKTQWLYFWLQGYSEYFFVTQVANFVGVFVIFEHHWHKINDEEYELKYAVILGQIDKKTFEGFKYAFAFLPFVSFYLFGRSIYQKFDTIKFVQDYGFKREL